MTRLNRAAVRTVATVTFAAMIALSIWILCRPATGRKADCSTAHAMWTYYQSQAASQRAATLDSNADNNQTEAAYQNMVNGLQGFADRIATPEIRAEADTIVAINRDMFAQWKIWAANSRSEPDNPGDLTPSDRQFGKEFAQSAKQLKHAHDDLETLCGS
jgi:hypothetical protein